MPRTRMVTRHIKVTSVKVLCCDSVTKEVSEKTVIIPKWYKSRETLKAKVQEQLKPETLAVATIISAERSEKLYGMLEKDFLKMSQELDEKPRKKDE